MEERLHDAAIRGDILLMRELLRQDPLVLERIQVGCLVHTPLHAAAFRGRLPLVAEILRLSPGLALVLDHRRWSPLHLAASQGHADVAKALVLAGPEMCAVLDGDGNNPLHLAAIKGRVGVLAELVRVGPHVALAPTAAGESILHLCAKHNRLDALKLLLENIRDPEFVNAKDGGGNNIFHLAVKYKQIQTIKYILAQQIKVDINATNAMGFTALDILLEQNLVKDFEIRDTLRQAGALRAEEIPSPSARNNAYFQTKPSSPPTNQQSTESPMQTGHDSQNNQADWLQRRRDTLMVVASLIATMAFQAGLSPPGGVWQDNVLNPGPRGGGNEEPHRAGEAIIAYNYNDTYKLYLRSNTIGFVASLSIILLLISGLPLRRRRYMWTLQAIMWVTITSMAFTYAFALVAVTPRKHRGALKRTLVVAVLVWCVVMALVLLGNTIRLVMKWVKGKSMDYWKGRNRNQYPPQVQMT